MKPEDERIEELRRLWQQGPVPEPWRELSGEDAATRAAVRSLQNAWAQIQPKAPAEGIETVRAGLRLGAELGELDHEQQSTQAAVQELQRAWGHIQPRVPAHGLETLRDGLRPKAPHRRPWRIGVPAGLVALWLTWLALNTSGTAPQPNAPAVAHGPVSTEQRSQPSQIPPSALPSTVVRQVEVGANGIELRAGKLRVLTNSRTTLQSL
ncbi:MAG: hypothetical protein R3F17_11420 [Planctomycetota bacterium]